jgi:hypothetical protein
MKTVDHATLKKNQKKALIWGTGSILFLILVILVILKTFSNETDRTWAIAIAVPVIIFVVFLIAGKLKKQGNSK